MKSKDAVSAERLATDAAGYLPMVAEAAATTAYLFGRKTYQKTAAHWPAEPDTNPIAAHLNAPDSR